MARAIIFLSSLAALSACVSPGPAPHQPAYASRADTEDLAFQLALLRQDIGRLRHDVCVLAVKSQLVEVRRDPANGRNRVLARDGAILEPESVCPG